MMLFIAGLFVSLFSVFTVFPLILSVVAKILPTKKRPNQSQEADFACIITVYKDIDCAKNLIDSLLNQQYTHYHIYLVADDCDVSGFEIKNERLTVLAPAQPFHSKVKSIHHAIDNFDSVHTHMIVFDPDNLAHPNFLKEINGLHYQGFHVVQGKRVAKNLDTKIACLDAFSEYYYNYTQRTVPFRLGSSATIAGSGMSLEIGLFKRFLKDEIEKEGDKLIIAEDKMLQVYVVKQGNRIAFAEKAIVFDEKVSNAHQVKRQRTRWITSYFQHLVTGFKLFADGVLKLSLNQMLFAYTIIIPPMFIIGLSWMLASVLLVFISLPLFFSLQTCLLAFVANIFVALLLGNAPSKVTASLFYAPVFVLNQVKALFSMKDTKTSFLTTEKTKNLSLEDVLNPKP
jgi:cellulose synthase/poly-beta-1,6-N-acetylglucosamine synthase-like glycosyltransferase